jgi:hypothetical protein
MKATVSRRAMMAGIPAAAIGEAFTGMATGLAGSPGDSGKDLRSSSKSREGLAPMPAAGQPNGAPVPHFTTTDPVFDAIARHRQAMQAVLSAHEPPDALVAQLSRAEVDAFLTWLTTPPTTLGGVIATLEYASHQPYVSDHHPDDHVYTNLAESAQYIPGDEGDPDNILKAGEQFPAMIAAALRHYFGLTPAKSQSDRG